MRSPRSAASAARSRCRADAETHLLRIAAGDARRALTALEAGAAGALAAAASGTAATAAAAATAATAATDGTAAAVLTLDILEQAVDRAAVRYDRDGDQHYDVASAFIKSIRGSDVDAALHYLARMADAGRTRASSRAA